MLGGEKSQMGLAEPGWLQREEPPQASAAFGTLQKQWLQEAGETGRLQPGGMSLEKAARAKYLCLTNSGRDTQGDDKMKDEKSTEY